MRVTRVLPSAEWSRLAGTELATVWQILPPDTTTVLVVEDDGVIVGCWALGLAWHLEGLWIAESERRRGNVFRRLLRGMHLRLSRIGAPGVITHAVSPEVVEIIRRVGGRLMPGAAYSIPVRGRR